MPQNACFSRPSDTARPHPPAGGSPKTRARSGTNVRAIREKRARDSGKTGARIILNAHRQSDADRLQ